ncbi:sister chromatid cohesion acetyltransferas-like protein Eco1 [Dothidotthia symphoricarpi CBS 119687]|uniref:Sister chromatid cohesion acetyltransferas-like protein Eco1 n=1 Tax=Dothidotthia symphoricarpi CBS 119687 TaxID=1392245 RepID=A0A6A6ADY3_9PLEO|nr:sister chromatid cohesion acetyltransferas-like protein Eco1 [Dothidotthia symphoricarpi CBS 119687]KAF2130122.1 sister chromatid cohesion acetyltransferas-like protein Eco1 [Dothidotthia symphoricarpi CBS 119687]
MSSFTAKKVVRTYSRQKKRPFYDEELSNTKRRRVESAFESVEIEDVTTTTLDTPLKSPSRARDSSVPPTSSPKESPALFSDKVFRSTPPSSPGPRGSSAPSSPPPRSSPSPLQRRRPVFSLFKKKVKPERPATEPLLQRSHNAQSSPKQPPKKKRMVQMQLDLAGEHRKTCKTCGMEYIPSNAEDAALHKKFHAMNLGGVDFTRAMTERFRQRQIWSGGEGSFIAVIGRKDALVLRNRASDVLKVVNSELAAVPISDEELWSQAGVAGSENATTPSAKVQTSSASASPTTGDRFKVYLYIRGQKCVGACLTERIQEAFTVLEQADASEQVCRLPTDSESSSVSISTTADPAMLGISRIWTSTQQRKQGVARKLLDCARSDFLYGMVVDKEKTAFSQPTESGQNLARKWFGCRAGWHVYID